MIPILIIYYLTLLTVQEIIACKHYRTEEYSITECTNISSFSEIIPPPKEDNINHVLVVRNSNIPTIAKSSLSNLSYRTFDLDQNNIKIIEAGAFENLPKLEKLSLESNELEEIPEGVYNSLKNLKQLILGQNRITRIAKNAFVGLKSLQQLNLESNSIRVIQDDIFDSEQHLEFLDLSNNPLEQLDIGKLRNLKAFVLENTLLSSFDNDWDQLQFDVFKITSSQLRSIDFKRVPKAHRVYLSNNKLESIVGLDSLDSNYIALDNNRIKTINGKFINITFVNLAHNRLEILTSNLFNETAFRIHYIYLSHNQISLIEKDTFRNLLYLEILNLDHNNISHLDPKLFSDLEGLKYLDLSHNDIQDLQYGTFNNLIQLKVLNISDNKLKSLHENGLLAVISLEQLIFHNNKISHLDVPTLIMYKAQLKVVSLNHNDWNCEKLAETYIKFMLNNTIELPGLSEEGENFHGIACTSQRGGGWEDSEMSRFFNEDFKKSRFFQFFDEEYRESNFFKYLETYRNKPKADELVMPQVQNFSDRILVLIVGTQTIIVVLLLLNFWRRKRSG